MMLFAAPGLGSVSGVVHLAVRRPYLTAVAVAALATAMYAHTVTGYNPAVFRPVPAKGVVQHTPRPQAPPQKPVSLHALEHRRNTVRQTTGNDQITISGLNPVAMGKERWIR